MRRDADVIADALLEGARAMLVHEDEYGYDATPGEELAAGRALALLDEGSGESWDELAARIGVELMPSSPDRPPLDALVEAQAFWPGGEVVGIGGELE